MTGDLFQPGNAHPSAPSDAGNPWWLIENPAPKPEFKWPKDFYGKPVRSPTFFKMFGECNQKHSFRYRDGLKEERGLFSLVGKAVHGALEDAGRWRLNPGRRAPPPRSASAEELLHLLTKQPEITQDQGTEVLSRSREIIKNLPPVDFTNLWGTEHVWTVNVTGELPVSGITDVVKLVPDYRNPGGSPVEVINEDYKTGPWQAPTKEELAQDIQAGLTLVWSKRQWPGARRHRFRVWNVTRLEEVWIDWTPEIEDLILSYVRSAWGFWNVGVDTPNTGRHCRYCHCRTKCKAYSRVLKKEAAAPKAGIDGLEIDGLIHEYYRARNVSDLAEQRRKDAGARILEELGAGRQNHRAGNLLATKKSKRLASYRSVGDVVIGLSEISGLELTRVLDAVANISEKKLEAFLSTLPVHAKPEAEAHIDRLQSLNHTPPWIDVRQTKVLF